MPARSLKKQLLRLLNREMDHHDKIMGVLDKVESHPLWSMRQEDCRAVVATCLALTTGDVVTCSIKPAIQRRWMQKKMNLDRDGCILLVDTAVHVLAFCWEMPEPELHPCRALGGIPSRTPPVMAPRPDARPITILNDARVARRQPR